MKKPTKTWTGECVVCGKEFEYQEEQHEYSSYIPKRKHFFCSEKCRMVRKEQVYRERFNILPLKFRDIDCDRKELVKQGNDQSMFITGNVGVGKTVLMAGIAKEILRDPKREIIWVSYPGLIMELQSLFKRNDSITPYERAEDIAQFDGILCIDDLGAEKITDFVRQITYYIINYREQECLQTLITSNFSLAEIDEQIDPRISSRIAGMCKIVKLEGKDRRLQKKAVKN